MRWLMHENVSDVSEEMSNQQNKQANSWLMNNNWLINDEISDFVKESFEFKKEDI